MYRRYIGKSKNSLSNLLSHKRSFNNKNLKGYWSLIVPVICFCFSNIFVLTDCEKSEKNRLNTTDVAQELRKKLRNIREKRKGESYSSPELYIKIVGNTHEINITTNESINVLNILINWCRVLSGEITSTSSVQQNGENLFTLIGEKTSISVKINGKTKDISIFKDYGFTNEDVDYIARGYEAALKSNEETNLGLPSPPFHDARPFSKLDRFILKPDDLTEIFRSFSQPFKEDELISNSLAREQQHQQQQQQEREGRGSDVDALRALGVEVFDPPSEGAQLTWDALAGCEAVKQSIQDGLVKPLLHPSLYEAVVQGTREAPESCLPRAVLLEGPPGTGKTLTARILASQTARKLVHLQLDAFVSKYYGESEKRLSQILRACDSVDDGKGVLLFIDEVDAVVGGSRDSAQGIHEASRKLLSVLLQHSDGLQGRSSSTLLCATNRMDDLDPALISRFDLILRYENPDRKTMAKILKRYAKQLSDEDLEAVVARLTQLNSKNISSRDIKQKVCQCAERKTVSKLIASGLTTVKIDKSLLPTVDAYLDCVKQMKV